MNHPDDWAQDIYESTFIDRKNAKPVTPPAGRKLCPRCGGTGIGAPGEKYYEMGTGAFGCSECNGFGWV